MEQACLGNRRLKRGVWRQPAGNCIMVQGSHLAGEWFAIQVKPRMEWRVSAALRGKGYEQILPTYVWSQRLGARHSCHSRERRVPLFPGYVFCRFDARPHALVVTTPGVMRIVGFAGRPIAIEENEIVALKAIMESGIPSVPWPKLQSGDVVQITSGPLRGVFGVICRTNRKQQLVVSITILQRSALVEIQPEWIGSFGEDY